jgi:hypothetical protein
MRSELLSPDDLRYSLKVSISRNEDEVVLEYQRCDPKMVVRNRGAGSPELNENSRILFRCFPTGQQYANGRLGEQPVQQSLIPALLRATLKSGLDLTQYEKRNPDFLSGTQLLRQL